MSKSAIEKNSKISDLSGTLLSRENYVIGVFHHMHECRKKARTAYVRIGILGSGKIPHYRIEYDEVDQQYPIPIYGAFNGRNHKILADEDVLQDKNWSAERMNFEEVQNFLGSLRADKKRRI